jgi:fucose 4-O-acetylase-like acetyltransferase
MKVEKKFYTNLAALRIYLSFLVVSIHSFKPNPITLKKIIIKMIYNMCHVPTFFILSFYFSYFSFKSKNIQKIKIRFQRLLIPYFLWPIIFWSFNNVLSFLYIKIKFIPFKYLILQILTGHCIMPILWFQYNLTFVTLLISIISLLFNETTVFYILVNSVILGFFLQYSNYNIILFYKSENNKKYTFGRFFEIITHCIAGYIIASLNIVRILSKNRIISIILISININNNHWTWAFNHNNTDNIISNYII